MKYLKLYENNNSKEFYIIAKSLGADYSTSTSGTFNYEYQWDNEFKNQQEALEWMFNNYYVNIDPDPPVSNIHVNHDSLNIIYDKDIKIVKFTRTDADIDEALNDITIKVQTKKYNL